MMNVQEGPALRSVARRCGVFAWSNSQTAFSYRTASVHKVPNGFLSDPRRVYSSSRVLQDGFHHQESFLKLRVLLRLPRNVGRPLCKSGRIRAGSP